MIYFLLALRCRCTQINSADEHSNNCLAAIIEHIKTHQSVSSIVAFTDYAERAPQSGPEEFGH